MTKNLTTALAIATVLALGGCSGWFSEDPSEELAGADLTAAADEAGLTPAAEDGGHVAGPVEAFADRLLIVHTPEERQLRFCYFGATLAGLQTHRVMTTDPGAAADAYGNTNRIIAAVARVRASGGAFTNVEIAESTLALSDVLIDSLKTRGKAAVVDYATLDFGDIEQRIRLVARQSFLARAYLNDAQDTFNAIHTEQMTVEDGFAACEANLAGSAATLGGMLRLTTPPPAEPVAPVAPVEVPIREADFPPMPLEGVEVIELDAIDGS